MPVYVEGLAEIRKNLKAVGDLDSQKEITAALKRGVQVIAADARGRVPVRSGRAAGSISAGTAGAKAYVQGGKGHVVYYGWLDFGTRKPRRGNPRKVGPWSGSGKGPARGRFLYPAMDAKADEVARIINDGIGEVLRRTGF